MALLGWFRRAMRRPASAGRAAARRLAAKFDAAQTTIDNQRHWMQADGLWANAAASPAVRQRLRNRARYEFENNAYAKGIVLTLANDCIGTGPRLQVQTGDAAANARVEKLFGQWAQRVQLAEKLRTMRTARAVDGEAFATLTTNPAIGPVTLDLRLHEADQFATPAAIVFDPLHVDGIRFDLYGNPVEYHRLPHHPGDMHGRFNAWGQYLSLPVDAVIHLFRVDRPGQSRGVPEITAALPLFAQLRRFTLATIAAAETAADYAAVMYTDGAPDDETEVPPGRVLQLAARSMTTLPSGWKLGQIKAEHPTTTYKMFKDEILNEIGRCLNIPFNVAAGNSANYNYASGRLDHQVYFRMIEIDRDDFETRCLNRLLHAWAAEAALIPGYLSPGITPPSTWTHQWFWDSQDHVDPSKQANAQLVMLKSGATTLPYIYARAGLDCETELAKGAAVLGMTLDQYRQRVADSLFGPPVEPIEPIESIQPDEPPDGEDDEEPPLLPAGASGPTGPRRPALTGARHGEV